MADETTTSLTEHFVRARLTETLVATPARCVCNAQPRGRPRNSRRWQLLYLVQLRGRWHKLLLIDRDSLVNIYVVKLRLAFHISSFPRFPVSRVPPPPPAKRCRVFQSCVFHPCSMVPRFSTAFSVLAFYFQRPGMIFFELWLHDLFQLDWHTLITWSIFYAKHWFHWRSKLEHQYSHVLGLVFFPAEQGSITRTNTKCRQKLINRIRILLFCIHTTLA